MTNRPFSGTWNPETGVLTYQFEGMSQIEALAVLRLSEHALIRQMSGAIPGRPGLIPEPGILTTRAPGMIARRVDK